MPNGNEELEQRVARLELLSAKLVELCRQQQATLEMTANGVNGHDAVIRALSVNVGVHGDQITAVWSGLRQLTELIAGPDAPILPSAAEMAKHREEVSDLEKLFRRDDHVKGEEGQGRS
jgi:hypothetical protein